jgi:hypothetical protein
MSAKKSKEVRADRTVNIDALRMCVDLESGHVLIGIPNGMEGEILTTSKDAMFADVTDDFYSIFDAVLKLRIAAAKLEDKQAPGIIASTDVEAAKKTHPRG